MPRSWSWLHSALDTRVDCIERRRAADVHSVSLLAAEAQIGHRLRYVDLADQIAGRGIAANPVFVQIAPADRAPDAAIPVGAQSIGNARFRHFRKDLAVRQFAVFDIRVEHEAEIWTNSASDSWRQRVLSRAGWPKSSGASETGNTRRRETSVTRATPRAPP